MAKWLLTLKPLDPGSDEDPIVAVAETVPGDLHPEHPIVLPPEQPDPSPPLVIWGPNDPRPTPPIYLPPQSPDQPPEPPTVIWGPDDPRPTPPIFLPPQPQPPVDLPHPAHPIVLPPEPTPPIYIPPQYPDQPPVPPVIQWPCDPKPTHPIYIPIQPVTGEGRPAEVLDPSADKLMRAMATRSKSAPKK